MTDEELIQSFYHGNQGALAVLFERHNQGVFNFACRMLGNRADAEDTASEVFSRLCTSQGKYSPNAAFKTWLYTIARNMCLDKIRNRTKSGSLWVKKQETDTYEQIDIPSQQDGPAHNLEKKEIAQHIKAAIEQLPSDQREAIILREYEELSYDEIANILGCSLANVKVLIYRARTQLKTTIPSFIKEGQ